MKPSKSERSETPVEGVAALHEVNGSFLWQPAPVIVVISGPSGAGKDSVINEVRKVDGSIHFVVTATSRPRRSNEEDGRDYHFFSREEFEERLRRGEFLEYAIVYGDYKGVPRWELTQALECGQDVVLRVDVQGARTLRSILPDAVFVFIMAESEQEHLRRMRGRGSEDDSALADRLARLRQELQAVPEFDYVLINRCDALEQTAAQLKGIIATEKLRVNRTRPRIG
ncbi:MAG: guanylate kinase [Anaerolineae bacterium]